MIDSEECHFVNVLSAKPYIYVHSGMTSGPSH